MTKSRRAEIVLSILRLIETTRPPKKVYGYFTRRQLTELLIYLQTRKDDLKEIYTNARTLHTMLRAGMNKEGQTLFRNIERLSLVKER